MPPLLAQASTFAARLLIVVAIALTGAVAAPAGPPLDAAKVAKVKAAYLVNFTKYTKWPGRVFAAPDSPIQIIVLGRDEFGSVLEKTAFGKRVRGRSIEVKHVPFDADEGKRGLAAAAEAARGGHILYVGDGQDSLARAMIEALRDDPVLLVSDTSGFCRRGGMIGFVLRDGKIVFEANPERLKHAGLRVSSKLLKLATIVKEESE